MTPATSAGVHLRRVEENSDEIGRLAATHGERVGLPDLLAHLNRTGTRTPVTGRTVEWGWKWNEADCESLRWWPQGITTSADASDKDDFDGRRLLVTSWYSKTLGGVGHGCRISVIDVDTLEYRHVLIVVPEEREDGSVGMRPLNVHAGGLVWCGPFLHIAGTRRGIVTCAVDDIIKVASTEHTFGYRYVLPVRFGYDAAEAEGVEKLRYSFLSLDRGSNPPELIAGEYGRKGMTRRLVRYPLDPDTWHLASGEDGTSRPIALDDRGLGRMQGATVVRGVHYVTSSNGPLMLGTLYVGEPGAFTAHKWALPVGPEDISYWPSTDMLWSLTEHPGKRFVFCVRRGQFDAR